MFFRERLSLSWAGECVDAFHVNVFFAKSAITTSVPNVISKSEVARESEFFIAHHGVFVFRDTIEPGA